MNDWLTEHGHMTLQISTILAHFLDKCLKIDINIKAYASVLDLKIQFCFHKQYLRRYTNKGKYIIIFVYIT